MPGDDPFDELLSAGAPPPAPAPALPVSAPSGLPGSPAAAPAAAAAGPPSRFAAHVAKAYSQDQPSLLSALAMATISLEEPPAAPPADLSSFAADAGAARGSDDNGGGGGRGAAADGGGLSHAATMLDDILTTPTHSAAPIKISIKDPERVEVSRMGVPVGAFLTYLVRTESDQGKAVDVRRRFTDFDQLHKLLKEQNRGLFFPPLPEKAFFESRFGWSDSFVKVRRVDLQAYMRTIAGHPVLRASEELRLFLSYPEDLAGCPRWQQMLQHPASDAVKAIFSGLGVGADGTRNAGAGAADAGGAAAAAGGASGAGGGGGGGGLSFKMLRVKQSLMGVVAPHKPRKVPVVVPADEARLRQAKDHFKELMAHLSAASATARSLVNHMEALCEDMGALAKGFAGMARFEEGSCQSSGLYTPCGHSAQQRAADLQHVGTASMHAHNVMKTFALRTAASLVFLHDYHVLIPEAISALEEREAALAVVELLREELADKEAALQRAAQQLPQPASPDGASAARALLSASPASPSKSGADQAGGGAGVAAQADRVAAQLRGAVSQLHVGVSALQAGASEKKAAQLAAAAAQLQDQIVTAEAHYELLKARNLSELERLNLERADDFRAALRHFSRVQAQLAAAAAEVWRSAAAAGGAPAPAE